MAAFFTLPFLNFPFFAAVCYFFIIEGLKGATIYAN